MGLLEVEVVGGRDVSSGDVTYLTVIDRRNHHTFLQ